MSVSYGGDSITFADSSTISSGWTGFKNKIINGSMAIAQRNTTATGITTSGYFCCDRFAYYKGSGNVVVTITQTTDGPTGITTCQKVQTTTANSTIGASEYVGNAYYTIENKDMQDLDWGTASAKPLTLSFWVKSNKTGTYTVSPYINVVATSSYYVVNRTYTINQADTWEYKTISIPGFTTAVIPNNNAGALIIYWNVRCGTGYTSGTSATDWSTYTTTNWAVGHTAQWGTSTSDYISMTGIQLEKGSTASSFEYRPYGTELQLCQRYYEIVRAGGTMFWSSGNVAGTGSYVVEKRTAPTITRSTSYYAYPSEGSFNASNITTRGFTVNSSGSYLAGDFEWKADSEL